jgi:calcium binding protein 39
MILREGLRHEPLTLLILKSVQFWDFFKFVELSTFDVASDAFATFRDILIKHKNIVAEFLDQNYEKVLKIEIIH